MVTRIAPSEEESKAGVFSSATLEKASYCLRTDGTLIVEDIVGQKLIQEAREAFFQRYHRYLDGRKHHDARQVGEGRVMITVDLEPPFERRELVANPWLLPLLDAAFDGDFVLGAFGVVCSLPGAGPQRIHQDGGDIFPQATLNRLLPIVAVTVAAPLIEMNDVHGTTALWPGSHRDDKLASAEKGHERARRFVCVLGLSAAAWRHSKPERRISSASHHDLLPVVVRGSQELSSAGAVASA